MICFFASPKGKVLRHCKQWIHPDWTPVSSVINLSCSRLGLKVDALIPAPLGFCSLALSLSLFISEPRWCIVAVAPVSGFWPEAKWNKRRCFSSRPGQKRTQITSFEFWLTRKTSERAEDPGSYLFRISSPISTEPPFLEARSLSTATDSQEPLPEVF